MTGTNNEDDALFDCISAAVALAAPDMANLQARQRAAILADVMEQVRVVQTAPKGSAAHANALRKLQLLQLAKQNAAQNKASAELVKKAEIDRSLGRDVVVAAAKGALAASPDQLAASIALALRLSSPSDFSELVDSWTPDEARALLSVPELMDRVIRNGADPSMTLALFQSWFDKEQMAVAPATMGATAQALATAQTLAKTKTPASSPIVKTAAGTSNLPVLVPGTKMLARPGSAALPIATATALASRLKTAPAQSPAPSPRPVPNVPGMAPKTLVVPPRPIPPIGPSTAPMPRVNPMPTPAPTPVYVPPVVYAPAAHAAPAASPYGTSSSALSVQPSGGGGGGGGGGGAWRAPDEYDSYDQNYAPAAYEDDPNMRYDPASDMFIPEAYYEPSPGYGYPADDLSMAGAPSWWLSAGAPAPREWSIPTGPRGLGNFVAEWPLAAGAELDGSDAFAGLSGAHFGNVLVHPLNQDWWDVYSSHGPGGPDPFAAVLDRAAFGCGCR